ncbi:MAG: GatB/YqeY domain-containing protein [Alphaproteobacteria bacterium]|nr:MAG: GatB/YqeY domain-containing protein [Alphaproteobacteria bacterium]
MSLREQLQNALKEAMRDKNRRKVATLRLVLAAIKDRDIARRTEADERDDDVIIREILARMIKQRQDSIAAYEEGGRLELAEQERNEIDIIRSFLPRQLSDEEIRKAVETAIGEVEAKSLKDIGRVMAWLKEHHAGRMDFSKASRVVKELLGAKAAASR